MPEFRSELRHELKLLKLADYHDPILRQRTEDVSFPLSEDNRRIIADMVYSIQPEQLKAAGAPWDAAVGMAANQWGINKRIFLFCPTGDTVNGLEIVINPSYTPVNADLTISAQDDEWEGCFSVPLATGHIKRYLHIRVMYQNEDGAKIERELIGWPARVWQHENDHLDGYLYDDHRTGKCVEKRVFSSVKEVDDFYNDISLARKKEKK